MSLLPGTNGALDRRLFAVCLLCVVAVLAGCTAMSDDEELPDRGEIEETYTSLDAYSATFVFNSSSKTPESIERVSPSRTEGELIVRPGTGELYRMVELKDGSNSQIAVSNGTVAWVYDGGTNRARRLETTRTDSQRRQLRQIVARINRNGNEGKSESALPIVPIGISDGLEGGTDSESIAGFNVSTTAVYEGTEPVDGREAHVLTVESTDGSEVRGRWTYYLDTEWYVTLRSTSTLTIDGNQLRTSFRLQNVTFNSEVPGDQFEFTPPDNATVTGSKTEVGRHKSREQLAAVTDLRVPDPDVPAEFEFETARRTLSDSVESISLRYTSDVATLTVSRRNVTDDMSVDGRRQEVQIGDRTGVYKESPRRSQLRWRCPETTQSIRGSLSLETLVDIAESIDC
jgi:outer membrane lipoprotein-sorting protein